MSGWQDMIGRQAPSEAPASTTPAQTNEPDDDGFAPQPDPADYKAYILQRGRGRPPLFLNLRMFDARAGTLKGVMMSYPQLASIDYFDGHSIELNFGFRRFRIEGDRLSDLVDRLQAGSVLAIQEYSDKLWTSGPRGGPLVKRIVELRPEPES